MRVKDDYNYINVPISKHNKWIVEVDMCMVGSAAKIIGKSILRKGSSNIQRVNGPSPYVYAWVN